MYCCRASSRLFSAAGGYFKENFDPKSFFCSTSAVGVEGRHRSQQKPRELRIGSSIVLCEGWPRGHTEVFARHADASSLEVDVVKWRQLVRSPIAERLDVLHRLHQETHPLESLRSRPDCTRCLLAILSSFSSSCGCFSSSIVVAVAKGTTRTLQAASSRPRHSARARACAWEAKSADSLCSESAELT